MLSSCGYLSSKAVCAASRHTNACTNALYQVDNNASHKLRNRALQEQLTKRPPHSAPVEQQIPPVYDNVEKSVQVENVAGVYKNDDGNVQNRSVNNFASNFSSTAHSQFAHSLKPPPPTYPTTTNDEGVKHQTMMYQHPQPTFYPPYHGHHVAMQPQQQQHFAYGTTTTQPQFLPNANAAFGAPSVPIQSIAHANALMEQVKKYMMEMQKESTENV